MAYFAEIDSNNIVLRVLKTSDSMPNRGHDWLVETFGGTWIESFKDGTQRYNAAGIGSTYDPDKDCFVDPQPYESWSLNLETMKWEPPSAMPEDGEEYFWNEEDLEWQLFDPDGILAPE